MAKEGTFQIQEYIKASSKMVNLMAKAHLPT